MTDHRPSPESRDNARDEDQVDAVPEDAALSALLGSLATEPAPQGFRDAVLAALLADDADLARPPTAAPATVPATPSVSPAATPETPSRLRRAMQVVGGLAVTAAALSGIAVLWSSTADRSLSLTGSEPRALDAEAPSFEADSLEDRANVERGLTRMDEAPNELAMRDGASQESAFGDLAASSTLGELRAAEGLRVGPPAAPGAAAMVAPAPASSAAKSGEFQTAAIRVVRVQSPSVLSNQRAVLQFEAAAARNSILPRPADRLGIDEFAAESEPSDDRGPAGAAMKAVEPQIEAPLAEAPPKGPVGVLVVAEPDRIEAALRDFRADLAADAESSGVQLADGTLLALDEANRLLKNASPPPADLADANERSLAVRSRRSSQDRTAEPSDDGRMELDTRNQAFGAGGAGLSAAPVEREEVAEAADADAVDQPMPARVGPAAFQMRVAPPAEMEEEIVNGSQANPPRASEPREDPAVSRRQADDFARKAGDKGLDALRNPPDARVSVLFFFEPPEDESAEPTDAPPR